MSHLISASGIQQLLCIIHFRGEEIHFLYIALLHKNAILHYISMPAEAACHSKIVSYHYDSCTAAQTFKHIRDAILCSASRAVVGHLQ